MITTSQQLGLARIGVKEFVNIRSKESREWTAFCPIDHTTQDFETFKQVSDLGYPQATNEGGASMLDNKVLLYTGSFTPVEFTQMFGMTYRAQYTDQYNFLTDAAWKNDLATSFADLDALAVANILNNGFSSGYTGIDGVSLFNSAHPYKSYPTWSNLFPAVALSYNAIANGLGQMRSVKTARGKQMRFKEGCRLIVPPALWFTAMALRNSMGIFDTANRADNQLKNNVMEVQVCEELSSTKAYFLTANNPSTLGLFYMEQMPFELLMDENFDPKTRTKYTTAFKSFVTGWRFAQFCGGSQGN